MRLGAGRSPVTRSNYTALSRSTSRQRAHTAASPHPAPGPRRLALWSIPWWAVVVSVLVILTAAFAVEPIRDPATLQSVGEASLIFTPAYLALAPISAILDTLTLLTVAQHIAIIVSVIVLFIAWRVWRGRATPVSVKHESLATLGLLIVMFLVYAAVAFLPRPMAQLTLSDDTVLAVDFHAHTKYSHDGRAGWTEDDVRAWHRGAGFDAAYITDHATFEGAERGIAANPGQAGEGTMMLQGIEAFYRGEHVNALSAGRRIRGLTTPDLKNIDEQSLALASLLVQAAPILIETIPGDLSKVVAAPKEGGPGVRAIEIIDGSPRGLSQGRTDRTRILQLADSFDLALVTGSDNHGYGRAAPAWTLLRIPGWRGMTTDSLSRGIEDALRRGRRSATRTVERRVAGATNPLAIALSLPLVLWRMLTTLSADERVMWLVWTWGVYLIIRAFRAYRPRPSETA